MNESMENITQHSIDQFFYFQLSITSGLPESFNDLFIFFFVLLMVISKPISTKYQAHSLNF